MKRYRVIYDTMPTGSYAEFSAVDDTAALAHVKDAEQSWGKPVMLAENTGPTTQRTVPLPPTDDTGGRAAR